MVAVAAPQSKSADTGFRCPVCVRAVPVGAAYCGNCGASLYAVSTNPTPPRAEIVIGHGPRPLMHRILRILLAIWLVAYPVISCAPIIGGVVVGGSSGGGAMLGGLFAGWLLFAPWIVGILVIGLLTLLSR